MPLDLLMRLLAGSVPLKYNEQVSTDLYETMRKGLAGRMRLFPGHDQVHLETRGLCESVPSSLLLFGKPNDHFQDVKSFTALHCW